MVVIGLGSPFLTDDSVGPCVVRALASYCLPDVRLVESHAGGLLLLEELAGVKRAVIVDALLDPRRTPGELVWADCSAPTHNAACSHDCTLPEALSIGRAMGLPLPEDGDIRILGIVADNVTTFGEVLTADVARAVSVACHSICDYLAGPTQLEAV